MSFELSAYPTSVVSYSHSYDYIYPKGVFKLGRPVQSGSPPWTTSFRLLDQPIADDLVDLRVEVLRLFRGSSRHAAQKEMIDVREHLEGIVPVATLLKGLPDGGQVLGIDHRDVLVPVQGQDRALDLFQVGDGVPKQELPVPRGRGFFFDGRIVHFQDFP